MRSDSRNYTTEKSLSRVCYISRSTQQMYCMDLRLGEPEPTTACSYNATQDGKKLWRFCYISESIQQLYCMDFSLGEPEKIKTANLVFLASKGIYLGYDKPCGELTLAENCIEIISDKSNFLGMFLEIQTDIFTCICREVYDKQAINDIDMQLIFVWPVSCH